MIEIFYKSDGQMMVSQSETVLPQLNKDSVVWIDLFNITGEEKRATEAFLGTTIQSRAQAEEIESSSRFSETEDALFANTNFLIGRVFYGPCFVHYYRQYTYNNEGKSPQKFYRSSEEGSGVSETVWDRIYGFRKYPGAEN